LGEKGDDMSDDAAWSMCAALIMVSDLDRSVSFYTGVAGLQEVLREPDAAVLGVEAGQSATLYLKRARRGGHRTGQETLGVRAVSFYSESVTELDRIEERLKELDALLGRRQVGEEGRVGLVFGHDPDRLPLAFVCHDPNRPLTGAEYERVSSLIYGWDL
jgi:catechol 2,3-dioxygenase-like lactoylglutathione lyase family enzyme